MIEITVKIDTDVVETCVRQSWAAAFDSRSYGGGAGLKIVQSQVDNYIKEMDLSGIIAKSAAQQLRGVVDRVVAEALRRRAASLAKQMAADGTLFQSDE